MIQVGLKRPVESVKEGYTFPVLTMAAIEIDKPGANRRFLLNQAAINELDLTQESKMAWGCDDEVDNVYTLFDANLISDIKPKDKRDLKKNKSFANKQDYEQLAESFKLDVSKDNEFYLDIIDVEITSIGTIKMGVLKQLTEELIDSLNNPVEEEIVDEVSEDQDSVYHSGASDPMTEELVMEVTSSTEEEVLAD